MSVAIPLEQRDALLKQLEMDTNAATGESHELNAEELAVQEQVSRQAGRNECTIEDAWVWASLRAHILSHLTAAQLGPPRRRCWPGCRRISRHRRRQTRCCCCVPSEATGGE